MARNQRKPAVPRRARAGAKPKAPREKMHDYRNRMRAKGLRLVQVWVPDTRRPGFAARVRRESLMVQGTAGERDAIAALEALAEDSGEWS